MAEKILMTAVNGKEKSRPFVVYMTGDAAPKGQVVLRLDDATDRDGEPQTKLSNHGAGLIVSHTPEYIEGVLTGFRRQMGDTVCVIVERFKDDIPSLKSLANTEVF